MLAAIAEPAIRVVLDDDEVSPDRDLVQFFPALERQRPSRRVLENSK